MKLIREHMSPGTVRRYTVAEKRVSDALLACWREADDRQDWEVGEVVKTALDALGLPWVTIRADDVLGEHEA